MPESNWVKLGPVAEFDQLAAIYQAICGHMFLFWLPTATGRIRSRTKIMGGPNPVLVFDHDFKRYVEQSSRLPSEFSRRVREDGVRIVLVIDTKTKGIVGRIEDGTVYQRIL